MAMLEATMNVLKGRSERLDASDVPGLVIWLFENGAVESIEPNAADLLERALADCPDPSLVTPQIREMATLLRSFQERVRRSDQ